MTIAAYHQLRRLERTALVVGATAVVVAALLAWKSPATLPTAWRVAVFLCLQPAIGSLVFVLIHRLTGGRWMNGLAPFLTAGVRLLPWVWLLVLPLLRGPIAIDATAPAAAVTATPSHAVTGFVAAVAQPTTALEHAFATDTSRHFDAPLRVYFSRPVMLLRNLGYALLFFLLSAGAARVMHDSSATSLRWLGPAGLIVLVFALHPLAIDWFGLLEPGWRSTGFPLVWITGQALAGLAAAIAAALCLGADPAAGHPTGRPRGLDWGNLLLAAVMSWTYVAFVEWLIIWSGNLPAETSWYRHRSHGGWSWFLIALAALEFAAPFALLLSRPLKQRRGTLAVTALLLLAGQFGYTIWLILPALPVPGWPAAALIVATAIAALALFTNRYLAAARKAAAVFAA